LLETLGFLFKDEVHHDPIVPIQLRLQKQDILFTMINTMSTDVSTFKSSLEQVKGDKMNQDEVEGKKLDQDAVKEDKLDHIENNINQIQVDDDEDAKRMTTSCPPNLIHDDDDDKNGSDGKKQGLRRSVTRKLDGKKNSMGDLQNSARFTFANLSENRKGTLSPMNKSITEIERATMVREQRSKMEESTKTARKFKFTQKAGRSTVFNEPEALKKNSIFTAIILSPIFDHACTMMIFFNGLWTGISADHNHSTTIMGSLTHFLVIEQTFMFFFAFEIISRFLAIHNYRLLRKDAWFWFDLSLVLCMSIEIWLMPFFIKVDERGMGKVPPLLRIIRLVKISRVVKLMSAVPELLIIIKGMRAAARSVITTLMLLAVVIYVFALIFQIYLGDVPEFREEFGYLGNSMLSLFQAGTLLDECTGLYIKLKMHPQGLPLLYVMMIFILFSSFTILNMLIGILCEVASTTKVYENEKLNWVRVKKSLTDIFFKIDVDGTGTISKDEFLMMVEKPEVLIALSILDVQPIHLLALSETIFASEDELSCEPIELTFEEFLDIVYHLRPGVPGSVLDIAHLVRATQRLVHLVDRHVEHASQISGTFFDSISLYCYNSILNNKSGSRSTITDEQDISNEFDMKSIKNHVVEERTRKAAELEDELHILRQRKNASTDYLEELLEFKEKLISVDKLIFKEKLKELKTRHIKEPD